MTTPNDPTIPADSLDGLIAAYLEAVDAGQSPDRQELLDRYPRHAEQLRSFFADHDLMDRAAAPLRLARTSDSSSDAATDGGGTLPRVRYFGDYELLEEIARGGMGIVYKARQVSLDRIVALKMILAGQFASESEVQRFYAEARAAANLQHPNIVAIHEVGQHENQHYFSMDYIDGKSLARVVRENPLPAEKAAGYLKTIAEAIEFAHRQGTLHRDLKPSNVLIDRFDQPQVTDFGLAKRIEGTAQLTATGSLAGTPSYMPPEQAGPHVGKLGPASDVYSLGALLYELLTGRPPFLAETLVVTLNQVLNCEPVSPRLLNPKVPRDLETICLKCLEKQPPKRYGTAAELAQDLGRFLRHEPIAARPVAQWERAWRWCKRNRTVSSLSAAIAAFLVVAAIGGSVLAVRERNARTAADQNAHRADKNAQLASEEAGREAEAAARATANADEAKRNLYFAHMHLARQSWEQGHGRAASALLDQYIPGPAQADLRGWEWYYHHRLCHQELRTIGKDVNAIAFSPDGRHLATAGKDGTVRFWDVATGKELMALHGHKSPATFVVYSPDGQRLATAGDDQTVRVWDVKTGRQLVLVSDDPDVMGIHALAFNADGSTLGVVDIWGKARLLNALNGRVISRSESNVSETIGIEWDYPEDGGPARKRQIFSTITGAAFGAHLSRVAAASLNTSEAHLRIWQTPGGDGSTMELPLSQAPVNCLSFSPDGKWLATGATNASMRLWDVSKGKLVSQRFDGVVENASCLAFNSESSRVAVGEVSGNISLWQVPEGKRLRTFSGHAGAVKCLAFNFDGSRLVSAGTDGTAMLWDLTAQKHRPANQSESHRQSLRGLDVATTSGALGHKVYESMQSLTSQLVESRETFAGAASEVVEENFKQMMFSADGKRLVGARIARAAVAGLLSSDQDESQIWDVSTWLPLAKSPHHGPPGMVPWLDFVIEADGAGWGAGLTQNYHAVIVCRLPKDGDSSATARVVMRFREDVKAAVLSHDGTRVAAADGQAITVCDVASGKILWSTGAAGPASPGKERGEALAFSPSGRCLVAFTHEGACAWNLEDPHDKPFFLARFPRSPFELSEAWASGPRLAFSADDRILAVADDASVLLWNTATNRLLHTLTGHSHTVRCLAFSPEGKRLVSGGEDHTLKIWDVSTGQELLTLKGHTDAVSCVAFSPDGFLLGSTSDDGTLLIFDAHPSTPELEIAREARGVIGSLVVAARSHSDLATRIEAYPGVADSVREQVRHWAPRFWKDELEQRAKKLNDPLFERLLLKSDVIESLRKDKSLDDEVRAAAIEQASRHEDDRNALVQASWQVARRPDATPEEYQRALHFAEALCRIEPDNMISVSSLGVAQYRAGQYADSIKSLERSNKHNSASKESPQPSDLAFLAMSHHALGHAAQAQEYLRQLSELLKQPRWQGDEFDLAFLKEAQKRLGQKP